ncbi:hypothetical protein LFL96_25960 [Paraburkholderia sp. D15]|uniref:hypothetical protein n=1 Tax=Paraburkholderia sp. D15 TaxID=2880218 RepID=UPI00247AB721|nr:hypothetical protein [Paraburkholderia sp. D15]WGS54462.1 hypothetical protein LFL96_25960 [Paraburkholderia sp. D15]
MNNDLASYGYQQPILLLMPRRATRLHTHLGREFMQDKKLAAVYAIVSRFKNFPRHGQNNEALSLEFDSNLSPDFCFSHVYMATGKSLSVSLIESDQPTYGNTALTLLVHHTNESQELFTNGNTIYCQTLSSTVAKRLQHYKQAFDTECQQLLDSYLSDGFSVNRSHVIANLASHLIRLDKKLGSRFLTSWGPYASVNNVLTMFSALNGDCLHQRLSPYESSTALFTRQAHPDEDLHVIPLEAWQEDSLEQVTRFYHANMGTVIRLFEDCRDSYNNFSYASFKERFLDLFSRSQGDKQ